MIRHALIIGLLLFEPVVANADAVIKALEERGFLPTPSIYLKKFGYDSSNAGDGFIYGTGFFVRLPDPPERIRQVLAVAGERSVILDVIEETGSFSLSPAAVQALRLQDSGTDIKRAEIDIVALMRSTHRLRPAASDDSPRAMSPDSGTGIEHAPVPIAAPRAVVKEPTAGIAISFADDADNSRPVSVFEWSVGGEADDPVSKKPPEKVPSAADTTSPIPAQGNDFRVVFPPVKPRKPGMVQGSVQTVRDAVKESLALQAGYFANRVNAERFVEGLRKRLLPARIIERRNGNGDLRWQILVGPFSDHSAIGQARLQGSELLEDAYVVWTSSE